MRLCVALGTVLTLGQFMIAYNHEIDHELILRRQLLGSRDDRRRYAGSPKEKSFKSQMIHDADIDRHRHDGDGSPVARKRYDLNELRSKGEAVEKQAVRKKAKVKESLQKKADSATQKAREVMRKDNERRASNVGNREDEPTPMPNETTGTNFRCCEPNESPTSGRRLLGRREPCRKCPPTPSPTVPCCKGGRNLLGRGEGRCRRCDNRSSSSGEDAASLEATGKDSRAKAAIQKPARESTQQSLGKLQTVTSRSPLLNDKTDSSLDGKPWLDGKEEPSLHGNSDKGWPKDKEKEMAAIREMAEKILEKTLSHESQIPDRAALLKRATLAFEHLPDKEKIEIVGAPLDVRLRLLKPRIEQIVRDTGEAKSGLNRNPNDNWVEENSGGLNAHAKRTHAVLIDASTATLTQSTTTTRQGDKGDAAEQFAVSPTIDFYEIRRDRCYYCLLTNFSVLQKSFIWSFLGLVLFCISFPCLYWNEGDADGQL